MKKFFDRTADARSGENHSTKNPEWYWDGGLHDAKILSVEELAFPYDCRERKPIRNCMKICLESKGALYDRSVKEIHFYNYRLLTPDVDLGRLNNFWWMEDQLGGSEGKWILKLTLTGLRGRSLFLSIHFESAEVMRE